VVSYTDLNDVIVGVNTSASGDQCNASISVEVPEGKTVHLVKDYIAVSVSSQNSWESKLSGLVLTGPSHTGAHTWPSSQWHSVPNQRLPAITKTAAPS